MDYSISTYVASKFSEHLQNPFPSKALRTNLDSNSGQSSSKVLIQKQNVMYMRTCYIDRIHVL